ncbi:hypothetical protein C8R45DRAFT_933422 [Mycena sanguinolenta]|nr:hypothetical protein C8R45DRAFT_933422 [Mycena sanguinolenta]
MTLPQSRVPYELWGRILENVRNFWDDDKPTIKNFSLTCRDFCGISRPRLFSKIRFTPYFTDSKGRALLPSPSEVERRIERLDFLSSPGVASLVRHFSGRIGHFPRTLHMSCWTRCLSVLCSGFRLDHDPKLDHGEDYWIPVLHPDYLRVLTMDFVARIVHSIPPFPNVYTLTTFSHDKTSSQNLTVMSKFPGVRILTLLGKEFATESVLVQPQVVFPHLEEYYGPSQALSLFLAAAPLKRVQVECAGPKAFLARIQAVKSLQITSLNAKFTELDNAAFNKIVELLPQLTELLITVTVSDTCRLFKREIYDDYKLPKDEVLDGRHGDCIRSGFLVRMFSYHSFNLSSLF